MSNTLYITVTQFTDVATGKVEFGFVATDADAEYFEQGYATLADFLEAYPTEDALIEHVTSLDCFFGDQGHVICSFPSDAQRITVKPPGDVEVVAARLREAIYGNRAVEAILLQDRYRSLTGQFLPGTVEPGQSFEEWASEILKAHESKPEPTPTAG